MRVSSHIKLIGPFYSITGSQTVCYDLGHFYFMAVVYKHIRKDTNEVFYIGIGKTEKRAYNKTKRNSYWKRIVDKHDYDIVLIETDVSWETACELERKLIKEYGRYDLGLGSLVNMTDGGDGTVGIVVLKETKQKMRDSAKFRNAKPPSRKGAKHSKETIQKQKEAKIGKKLNPFSEQHKQKIAESIVGKKHSEEAKQKMKKPKSELHIQNMRESRLKWWANKKLNNAYNTKHR